MDGNTGEIKKATRISRTIETLRLDLKSAGEGKTWLLLPEGFRAQEHGLSYPLPSRFVDLQRLSTVFVPNAKRDSGTIYIRRAIAKLRERGCKQQSALLNADLRSEKMQHSHENYKQHVKALRTEMREAVDTVKREAEQAIANLNDLFTLGRKGIEAQMRAHLEGKEWQDERIDSRAFRECFRMVTQAVKGLGLPSDQRDSAAEAVVEELAASLEATKDAISLAKPVEDETEH